MASEFFNDNLKKVNHPSPMIFIPGFDARTLSSIIDYVYDGEVQLFQEELDPFLDAAQKLKINGLLSSLSNDGINDKSEKENDYIKRENEDNEPKIWDAKSTRPKNTLVSTTTSKEKTVLLTQNEVARNTVNDLIMKCIEGWKCKECGKICSTRSQIGLHVEIHVQGLSFPCIFCSESFVSRNSLARHKFINHKK